MATNVNVWVTSESDGTMRNNVPDWLIHFKVKWTDNAGSPQQRTEDEYFLLLLNWLKTNHPAAAKDVMEDLVFRIARVKYGVDDAEQIG